MSWMMERLPDPGMDPLELLLWQEDPELRRAEQREAAVAEAAFRWAPKLFRKYNATERGQILCFLTDVLNQREADIARVLECRAATLRVTKYRALEEMRERCGASSREAVRVAVRGLGRALAVQFARRLRKLAERTAWLRPSKRARSAAR